MKCYYVVYKATPNSIVEARAVITENIDDYFPTGTIILDIYRMISMPDKKGVVK